MEASEPKWVKSVLNIIGVNSLRPPIINQLCMWKYHMIIYKRDMLCSSNFCEKKVDFNVCFRMFKYFCYKMKMKIKLSILIDVNNMFCSTNFISLWEAFVRFLFYLTKKLFGLVFWSFYCSFFLNHWTLQIVSNIRHFNRF